MHASDVEYHDDALDDGARWTGLQVDRTPGSRLVVIDFTYEAWGRLEQNDPRPPQNRVWGAHHKKTLERISKSLVTGLRHTGCIHGNFLACDSGG